MLQKTPDVVAAVDLGSNSFHMIVCRLQDGKLQTLDRLKEMVRLASGLDSKNYLDQKTQARALACLQRFGQRIGKFPPESVRIVGTNTLRTAKNAGQFLEKAEQALGHRIEIISGIEEARMIYQGVAHSLVSDAKKRLVMDIGGGSTEYIIGTNDRPELKESLHMGCVSMSNLFFKKGRISAKKLQKAILYAEQKLEPIELNYYKDHWDEAIGASGTLRSVNRVLQASGWSNNGITRDGLECLYEYIIKQKHIDDLELPELDIERKPVFPGGFAIIYATFTRLGIEQMTVSEGALREGLVYDLVGRIYNRDIRSESVNTLATRYHVDRHHAERVQQTIHDIINQLDNDIFTNKDTALQFLDWAAQLHEIGHDIAHSAYHKHSAYIAEHADLAGFSRQDQLLLSRIIYAHRRKFSRRRFNDLPSSWDKQAPILAMILRLSVVLHRNRHDVELPDFSCAFDGKAFRLKFPDNWLADFPLTKADLKLEKHYLKSAHFMLDFS